MSIENKSSQAPLENRESSFCGNQSKVALIEAGDTLVARLKQEHEMERQSRMAQRSENKA
jgi:hypothetical protein